MGAGKMKGNEHTIVPNDSLGKSVNIQPGSLLEQREHLRTHRQLTLCLAKGIDACRNPVNKGDLD